jgi:hypothetical protein
LRFIENWTCAPPHANPARMRMIGNVIATLHRALLLAVLAAACCVAPEAVAEWNVQVAGLRVVAPAPGGDDGLRAFNWSPGVTVSLLVTAQQGNIVSVDNNKSKITSFTDDKGTVLSAATARRSFSSSSESGPSVIIEANASGQPTKGATLLNIVGKIVAQTASQTKQFAAENVAFKTGTEFRIGNIPLTIAGTRLSGKDLTVTLKAKQDLAAVSRLEFYDEQENKIESRRSSWSTSGSGPDMNVSWDFILKENAERGKIVATCWTDLKTVEVPFSVKAGVGL